MDRLSCALCSAPPSAPARPTFQATHPLTTPRCYFYGAQRHPLCDTLTSQLEATHGALDATQPTTSTATSAAPADTTPTSTANPAHESACPQEVPSGLLQAASPLSSPPGPAGHVLVLSSSNMLEGGTGCHVWPAGLWLAQWLLNNPGIVRGKRCLELGAGTGVVGAVAAQLGASQVTSLCHLEPPH